MVSVRLCIAAAVAAMMSTTAFAADMPQPLPPPPQLTYQPPLMVMEQPEGAWYLRGDIGVGMLSEANFVYRAESAQLPCADCQSTCLDGRHHLL